MAAITFLPPSNATTMSMSSTKWRTSKEDWDPQEGRIRRLYLEQNKPLKEVMAVMEREHGFKATVKMYKDHITEWKLDKRHKKNEVMAVLRKKTERDAVAKASSFYLRGRPVDLDDVQRYLKRKRVSVEDAIRLRATTPPDLQCFTPQSVPGSPADPEVLKGSQQLFNSIRNYILGSLEAKTWVLTDASSFCVSVKASDNSVTYACISNLHAARHFLQRGSFQESGQFLHKASAVTRDLVLQEEPNMLVRLLDVVIVLRKLGWIDCANIILHQFSEMATIVLPEMHPLRMILNNLTSVNPELAEDALTRAWGSFTDTFEQAVGPWSATSIEIRTQYLHGVIRVRNSAVAEAQLRATVKNLKEVHGRLDVRYMEALLGLAYFLLFQQRFTDAAAYAEELIRCASKSEPEYSTHYCCCGMEVLAHSQYESYDDASAESSLRQAVDMGVAEWGLQDAHTLRLLARLEGWLKEFGRHEEGAILSVQIEEILSQSNDLV